MNSAIGGLGVALVAPLRAAVNRMIIRAGLRLGAFILIGVAAAYLLAAADLAASQYFGEIFGSLVVAGGALASSVLLLLTAGLMRAGGNGQTSSSVAVHDVIGIVVALVMLASTILADRKAARK